MSDIGTMLGYPSDVDKKIVQMIAAYTSSIIKKLIQKGLITVEDGIDIVEDAKKHLDDDFGWKTGEVPK